MGLVSAWIAEQVTEAGSVTALDISPEQVEQARATCEAAGLRNVSALAAGATDTGLPTDSFDLVYSRFVLMHLPDAGAALREMRRILKPGGVLAVEDGDFTSLFCVPSHPAFDRCFELYRAIGERRGLCFDIGPRLYRLALEAGFAVEEIQMPQTVCVRGDAKRLPQWTLVESGPALLEAGLATAEEIDHVVADMEMLVADETVLFAMAQMTQVIARK